MEVIYNVENEYLLRHSPAATVRQVTKALKFCPLETKIWLYLLATSYLNPLNVFSHLRNGKK